MKASEIIIKLTELISEHDEDLDVEIDFHNISRVVKPNSSVDADLIDICVENGKLIMKIRRRGRA